MFWTLAQCIVVVMGIERFLALRAPFFYTARCSSQAFLAVIGLLALASGGVGAFHMLVHRHDVRTDPVVYAGFVDSGSLAYNAFTLTQGLVWTVVLLLCNWAVTHELRRMEQRVTVMRMKDQSEYLKQLSLVHGAGREFARFMMAVNVVFLLSSLPNLIRFAVQYFCWRMSHISALLNPFLYGFLRKSLRSRIRRALNRHVPCLRSNQVEDLDPAPTTVRFNARLSSATMPRDPEASTVQLSA
nr:hypothetical protein BaRGS_000217 [Batillaria attramentaria]